MHTSESDAALVDAARGGDRAAFGILLSRHRPMLVALCTRMFDDPGLAEDAAQEAALQALLSLDRLQRPAQFGPWLSGIGLNICRRWLRDRDHNLWSWETLQGGCQVLEPIDWHAGPEEAAEEADLVDQVHRAVAGLPRGQREAVMLFYLSGLTHAETAMALGIEVGAVKTRLHNARTTLRRHLWTAWKERNMATDGDTQLVEMRVAEVRRLAADGDKPPRHVVVLEDLAGTRRLPIWIGRAEGEAMALHLEKVQHPRPLTYSFAASLLQAAGGRLREVQISKLVDNAFHALAVVEGPEGIRTVDARSSDALNLALLLDAPIRVASAVLEAEESARAHATPTAVQDVKQLHGEGTQGAAEIVAEIQASW